MRILIVEDEKRLADTLAELLHRRGYAVDVSYDGVSGLDNARSGIYDLVLLDAMLPELDGFSLLQQLRAGGETVPVLMLTARSDLSDRVRGLDCGADYYLTKPFETEELLACIRSLLRRGGEDVSAEIRMPEISICASNVSAMPAVRAYLLEMQRRMARTHNVIMDGRDIGTVVLPDAELKIFLTASAAARAQRRLLELQGKSVKADYDEVLRDIEYRDKQDTSRAAAPLKAAEDAVRVDTSDIDFEQSAALLRSIVRERLGV